MKRWQQLCSSLNHRISAEAFRCALQLAAGAVILHICTSAVRQAMLCQELVDKKELHADAAGQLLVALPVLISYPNFLSKVAWIATINYAAPMYLIAAVRSLATSF